MATKPESRLQRRIRRAITDEFGGWYFKVHGGPFQAAGVPDIVGCIAGFFVAIEVKMPNTGKMSPTQRATIKKIKKTNGIAFVAVSEEEAVRKLLHHLNSKVSSVNQLGKTWQNMKSRCYNEKTPYYKRYGAKGIRVCDRWLKGVFFFWLDMGYPPHEEDENNEPVKYSIDRIDPSGNYEPKNCRWLRLDENSAQGGLVTIDGKSRTLTAWAKYFGISKKTVRNRISRGWSPRKALTTPVDKRFHP